METLSVIAVIFNLIALATYLYILIYYTTKPKTTTVATYASLMLLIYVCLYTVIVSVATEDLRIILRLVGAMGFEICLLILVVYANRLDRP